MGARMHRYCRGRPGASHALDSPPSGLLDDDRTTPNGLRIGSIQIVTGTAAVVIDHLAGGFVPDLQPEPVGASAQRQLSVRRGEDEPVVALAIDLARRPGRYWALGPATTSHS